MATPPLHVPDELNHLKRVEQLLHGDLLGEMQGESAGGSGDKGLNDLGALDIPLPRQAYVAYVAVRAMLLATLLPTTSLRMRDHGMPFLLSRWC